MARNIVGHRRRQPGGEIDGIARTLEEIRFETLMNYGQNEILAETIPDPRAREAAIRINAQAWSRLYDGHSLVALRRAIGQKLGFDADSATFADGRIDAGGRRMALTDSVLGILNEQKVDVTDPAAVEALFRRGMAEISARSNRPAARRTTSSWPSVSGSNVPL